jgi:hypothetical protein
MSLLGEIAGALTIGSTSINLYDRILKKTYKCSLCGRPDEHKGKNGLFADMHFADGQHIELHLCKHCLKKYRPVLEPALKDPSNGTFSSPYNTTRDELVGEIFED